MIYGGQCFSRNETESRFRFWVPKLAKTLGDLSQHHSETPKSGLKRRVKIKKMNNSDPLSFDDTRPNPRHDTRVGVPQYGRPPGHSTPTKTLGRDSPERTHRGEPRRHALPGHEFTKKAGIGESIPRDRPQVASRGGKGRQNSRSSIDRFQKLF